MKSSLRLCLSTALLMCGALLTHAADAAPATAAKPAAPAVPATNVIRIKTGLDTPLKDETGVMWQADKGFPDGETLERPDVAIANTKTPSVYRAERYSMTAFHWKLPNGKYTVKLHFCETYEGIDGPGQRVFTYKVEGKEFKDFDIFKKSGGALRPYIETVEVEITDGSLDILFTPQVENPQINALEIIPKG